MQYKYKIQYVQLCVSSVHLLSVKEVWIYWCLHLIGPELTGSHVQLSGQRIICYIQPFLGIF